jgi:hypothetical protein
MPKATIHLDHHHGDIGTIGFELNQCHARGGPDFPVLVISSEINLRNFEEFANNAKRSHAVTLLNVTGKFLSPPHRPVARFDETVLLQAKTPTPVTSYVNVEIPLSLDTLTKIERERTKNLSARLDFKFLFTLHNPEVGIGFYSGNVRELTFEIPRSQWVDTLLPQLGYKGLEILEIRYDFRAPELPKSVEELQKARQCLLESQWDVAGLHCRKAVEVILDARTPTISQTARFKDKADAFCQANVPDAMQARLVSEQMKYLFSTASDSAHPTPPLKKPDAEYLIRTTIALVEYLSKLLA